MNIWKVKWTILFINCTILFIIQAAYEPLAIINHKFYGGLAYPSKENIKEFLFKIDETLLCVCPPEDESTSPLQKYPWHEKKVCDPLCTNEPEPSIQTHEYVKCGSDGIILDIGYYIKIEPSGLTAWFGNADTYFMEITQVCYRQETKSVLFVQYTLRAPYHLNIENVDTSPDLNRFRDDKHMYDYPEEFYTEENQKNSFKKIFHENYAQYLKSPSELLQPPRFFIAQQLVESDDMVLDPWKKTSYYYINTAPMWISVKQGSWKRANQYIRKLAKISQIEFAVYSGTFDQLTIQKKPIYLKNVDTEGQIPVPLLFWKFIVDKHCFYGFTIVIYNDIDNPPNKPTFCKVAECPKFESGQMELKNMDKKAEGFMHCCEFDEILQRKLNLHHLSITKLKALNENLIKNEGKELKEICEDKDLDEEKLMDRASSVNTSREQKGDELPLALIKNNTPGIDFALPDPFKKEEHKFFVGEWSVLICACPPVDSEPGKPLIPVGHKRPFRCTPSCKQHLVPKIKNSNSSSYCGNQRSRNIGYEINLQDYEPSSISYFTSFITGPYIEFLGLIDFCYKKNDVNLLFAVHKLRASYYLKHINEYASTKEPKYSSEEYAYRNPDEFYDKKNQEKLFRDAFPSDYNKYFIQSSIAHEYQSPQRYFVMQQLVESADMAVYPWKIATYYYINTVPMWVSVSRGSWKRANRYIRALSQLLEKDFLIYTGVSGQLEIERKPISLYHSQDQMYIPVPAILWKYIFDESTSRGVVIVIYNDIDLPPEESKFCMPTKCVKIGHHELEYSQDRFKGMIHCCTMNHDLKIKLNLDIKSSTVRPLINDELSEEDRVSLNRYAYDEDFLSRHVDSSDQPGTSADSHVTDKENEKHSRQNDSVIHKEEHLHS